MKRIISTILIVILIIGIWNPSSGMQKTTADNWWDSGWEYRKEITINHDMIDADLINFTILFHNTSSDFIEHAQSDGDDFVFIGSDGTTKYHHEIEYYDNTTGELIAWVKITSLSSKIDTCLYLYYGNTSCSSQENITDTWNSNYLGIWHLNQSMGLLNDSSANDNNATNHGAVYLPEAKVDGGYDLTPSDYISVNDVESLRLINTSFTLEGWVYIDTSSTSGFITKYLGSSPWVGWGLDVPGSGGKAAAFWSSNHGSWVGSDAGALSTGSWHYITMIFEEQGTTDNITFYFNGNYDSTKQCKSPGNGNATMVFGAEEEGTAVFLDGKLDEIRISNIAHNDSWIITNYNTINNPGTFLGVGSEQNKEDDYTPPTVQITQPEFGFIYANLIDAQFKIPLLIPYATIIIGKINITVDAEDNVGIKWVKIYIDNVEKANITEPPYIWLWDEKTIIFPYSLKVKACDHSGNENTDEIKVWKMQLFF